LGRYNFKPPLPLRLYRLCGTLLLRRLHQMIKQGYTYWSIAGAVWAGPVR